MDGDSLQVYVRCKSSFPSSIGYSSPPFVYHSNLFPWKLFVIFTRYIHECTMFPPKSGTEIRKLETRTKELSTPSCSYIQDFRYDQHQTRFRLDINLGGPDKVYRAFPGGYRESSCRLHGGGCGVETTQGEGWTLAKGGRVEWRYRGREGENKVGKRAHEYRWQVRVVLDDQPPSCTRLIYYPRLWLWGIGFVEGPAEGANRKLY